MSAPPRRSAALGALAALAVLLLAAPSPGRAVDQLRDASTAADLTGPLVAAVALVAWSLAGWLLLTALLTLLSRAPGGAGRAAAGLARRVAPAAVRQLVGAALGVTVVAGTLASPAAAAAGSPVTGGMPATAVSLDWPSGTAVPDLDWPSGTAGQSAAADASGPAWPSTAAGPAHAATAPDLDWPAGQGPAPVLGAATSTGAAADAVVVQPGDSLWSVAEHALEDEEGAAPTDAEVAAAWPAWWSANRDVVGDDPDLLLPGTALQPPAQAPTDTD